MGDRSCMDLGAVGAEETREKRRWSENSKVYTRKSRKTHNNDTAAAAANQSTATTVDADIAPTTEVATTTADVATTPAEVATTTADVATTTADVVTTTGEVATTTADLATTTDAAATTADVAATTSDIAATTGDVATTTGDVATTTGDVATTTGDVATTTGDIGEIATTATANVSTGIASQANEVPQDNVATTTGDVVTTTDLATTTANVATTTASKANEVAQDNNGTVTTAGEPVVPPPDSQSSPPKDASSQPQQLNLPQNEVVCDDSSSLKRQEGEIPSCNGVAPVRSAVTLVGDKVSISLSSATSKQEAKELKRKLLSDLDQVRDLAKKLDTKESQLYNGGLTNSADTGTGGVITGAGGRSLSQYSTIAGLGQGGGLRDDVEGVSAGLNDSRPFRRLSVSVMDISRRGAGNEIVEKEKRTPKANQFYQSSDFICGKDKLPPAESNKKQKSGGRKKQSGGGSEFDKQIFKKSGTLLQLLMKHKFGWVFNTPVDVKGLCLHDYYDVIKHPMDLGTVKNRLSKNWYKSPLEFAEDVRLTFSNAMTYNPEGQDVHVMAVELSNVFEQKWVEIEAEYSRKFRCEGMYDMGLPTPTSRLAPMPFYGSPPPTTPILRPVYQEMRHLDRSESFALLVDSRPKPIYSAPVGRTTLPKKPKAKDPNKRDMTFDEKKKLSTNLQALPSEKLDNIVQIIKKRNPSLCQQDEEIEVDIDSVDAETLWELDRFVTNYKKNLSKHKRRAELALERAQAQQAMQAANPATLGSKVPKETTPGVSSPAREGKQTDNASGSSSSSSSSSDSGSSSSDSDSDSSSASGSDRGE